MIGILSKAMAGAAAFTGIGTCVWGSYTMFLRPRTIEDQLSWNKFRVLNLEEGSSDESYSDYEKWTEIVNKWTTDQNLKNFVEQKDDNDDSKRLSHLKEKCKLVIKEPIEKDKYENAEKYCATKVGD